MYPKKYKKDFLGNQKLHVVERVRGTAAMTAHLLQYSADSIAFFWRAASLRPKYLRVQNLD